MAFRWKIPEFNAGLVDPQAVMQTKGEQGMQGFVPNSAGYATAYNVDPGWASQKMQGYNPNNVYIGRTPVVAGGDGAGYQFDSREIDAYMADQQQAQQAEQKRQQVLSHISELKTELASIEARIAEIDRLNPELAKNPAAWEIAAKRAEVGDMSAYDSMLGRSAQSGQASGIENELYNAYKLIYGLDAQNDYEQGAYANQIETALRRADEWSARNPNAKMPPIYADLRARYDAWKAGKGNGGTNDQSGTITVDNADKTINEMTSKLKAKTYSRADEKALQKWVDKNSNSPYTKAIQDFISAHTNETVEARKEAKEAKEWRDKKALEFEAMTPDQQDKAFNALTEKQQGQLLKVMTWATNKEGKNYLKRKV